MHFYFLPLPLPLSIADNLGAVHTNPFSFENATFDFTDTASVHTYPMKTINENGAF